MGSTAARSWIPPSTESSAFAVICAAPANAPFRYYLNSPCLGFASASPLSPCFSLPGYSTVSPSWPPPGRPHKPACLTSAASSGSVVFRNRRPHWVWRWRRWPRRRGALWARRRTSSPEPCGCSIPSAGSPLTVSCFPNCAPICWADRERRRLNSSHLGFSYAVFFLYVNCIAATHYLPSFPTRALPICPADARFHRLDRRAPFPVFPTARPSAGLARVSRSGRAANHAGRCEPHLLRAPTEHLHGARPPLPVIVRGGGFPHGCQSRKTRPLPLWRDRVSGDRDSSPRRTHAPRSGDCRPPLRLPRFETHGGFRRYPAGLGRALPQRRLRSARSQTAPGPWPVPRRHPATGQPHRTPQT